MNIPLLPPSAFFFFFHFFVYFHLIALRALILGNEKRP